MHLDALLADLAVVFAAGVLAVLTLGRLGLPPVAGFLIAGLFLGPHTLALVDDVHTIEVMAELGVALLLFTIGLEFSFDRLRRIARLVAVGGSLQVGLTALAATGLSVAAGGGWREGMFWGYLAALSSTAIVLRLLADRGELDAPHGRMVVGVLIFQDLCIVPMMLSVPLLAGSGADAGDLLTVLGRAAAVVLLVILGARQIVPRLLGHAAVARSREVFVLTTLLVATAVAWSTARLGLSLALGAFLAGIVVAETEFVHQVHSEVAPLRDALASLFFVSVGMLLDPAVLWTDSAAVAGTVALLVGGKLAVAALAVLLMRFPARVAMLSGVALAQVGEFSFVLLKSGQQAGLVAPRDAAVFLAASVVTMITAPLLVAHSPRLAAGAALLRPLERLLAVREPAPEHAPEPLRDHVVVAGLGLGGRALVDALEAARIPYVALELNPETVLAERARGRNVRYGDATSREVLAHVAHAAHARQVVLLLSDVEAGRRSARLCQSEWPGVPVLLRVHRQERDGVDAALAGVQVLAEDHQTAIEVVERVLWSSGAGSEVVAAAVNSARDSRGPHGVPIVDAASMAASLRVVAHPVRPGDRADGASLSDLALRARHGALAVARVRGGSVEAPPAPDVPCTAGDVLFLVGTEAQLDAARDLLRGAGAARPAGTTVRPPEAAPPQTPVRAHEPRAWWVAVIAPLVVTGALAFLHATLGAPLLLAYVVAVGVPALRSGRGPAALAAALSFVLANVTFIEPRGELTMEARILPLALLCVAPLLVFELLRRPVARGPA